MDRSSTAMSTGKVNEAEKELMAAQEALGKANSGFSSDGLFWLDPWSAQGQEVSAKLLPVAEDLRLHAERAIVLLAQVRQANPGLKEQRCPGRHGPGRAPARSDRHEV